MTGAGLMYRRASRRGLGAARSPVSLPLPADASPGMVESAVTLPSQMFAEPAPADPPRMMGERGGAPGSDPLAEVRRRYAVKDYADAADLARDLIAAGEPDPTAHVLLVRALANRGDLVEAGRACASGLDAHRTCAELIYLHAILLSQAGNHAEAADALRRALYLDRRLIVAHLALGDVLTRLGEAAAARRAFRAAEQLLGELVPSDAVSASDGEPAAHLAEVARSQIRMLDGSAA